MSLEYRDLTDRAIHEGDFIVYASLWSRCAVLKYGLVTRLEKRTASYYNKDETPTLRVISVDRSGVWEKTGEKLTYRWELQNKGKEITLSFLDRLLVVNKSEVPPAAFNLLVCESLKREKKQ